MSTEPLVAGTRFSFRKTMTVAEQAMFTGISGNLGALYVDVVQARKAGASNMVAFELAVAALSTTCLAKLGGPGRRVADMNLSFSRAVEIGSSIQATAEIESVDGENAVCRIECVHAETEEVVVKGTARLVPFSHKD